VAEGVTVIVGPNNVGKSLLLRDLQSKFARVHGRPVLPNETLVLSSIEIAPWGDSKEILDWLDSVYPRRPPGVYPGGINAQEDNYRLPSNQTLLVSQVTDLCQGTQNELGQLAEAFVLYLGPENRLGVVGNASSQDVLNEYPTTPAQYLYNDRGLESQVSALIERAFGLPLVVNRYGGSQITLHIGTVIAEETKPPQSKEYLQEIKALPQLFSQGDGIKAFAGILLSITTTERPLIIIDEPEAFLHPPQAYLLGRILAEQHDKNAQIVVATHSDDIVQGITSASAAAGTVTVARLTRTELTTNRVHQVNATMIGDLYQDPLIKYYNVLNGLFAHGVILCEADSDCTYYRAVLESIDKLKSGISASAVDIHFTHCGGKARLAKAVRALRAAEVPVVCAVDFDFLQDNVQFDDLVTACAGDPTSFQAWRNDVISMVHAKAQTVRRASAEAEILRVLHARTTPELSSGELSQISNALRSSSGWREAKLLGRGLLSGQAVTSFDHLNSDLRRIGIFVVERGELERFHPEISSSNKAAWLRAVLERKLYEKSVDAASYVTAMAENILERQ
jgi:AAA domain, putative AbiEii toxin, Type IV TA system